MIQIAYADSGKLIAISHGKSVHKSFEISVFDNNGNLIRKLTEPTTWQTAIDFSPDGRYIVAGGGGLIEDWGGFGKDCTIRVWEVASGKLRSQFTGHSAAVQAIQFSPDGTKIASGSVDKSVRIWDFEPSKSNVTTQDVSGSNSPTSPQTGQATSYARESSTTKLPKPVLYLSCDPAVATIPANPNFNRKGGTFVQGKFGQGTRFDGNSSSELNLKIPSGNASRSLILWLKNETDGKVMRWPWSYGSFKAFEQFGVFQRNGTWQLQTMGGDLDSELQIDYMWHHHAIIYDGNQVYYYVDGSLRVNQRIDLQTSISSIKIGGLGQMPNGN